VREPGRTAGPSAALGMTKGRVVTLIRGCQIGWTKKKQQVPLRCARMTKGRVVTFIRAVMQSITAVTTRTPPATRNDNLVTFP
jgi:hypothetical protein